MAANIDSADGNLGFQIAPMVDVVFVLMLFFMAIIGADATRELQVYLPGQHSKTEPTAAMVEIAADGSVLFNSEIIGQPGDTDLTQLRGRFELILQQFGDQDPVMIRPVSSTAHERVVQVVFAIQATGVKKVTFL